jgi:hypothetical protein
MDFTQNFFLPAAFSGTRYTRSPPQLDGPFIQHLINLTAENL